MNEEIETSEWKKNGCEKGATTGCSLSDQHIFSPKYNYIFLSDCPEIQNLCFEFQNNFCKSYKFSLKFWVTKFVDLTKKKMLGALVIKKV